MKQIINTDKAPQAIGPYSQAIKANGFLFISGQLPVDPQTGEFAPGGIAEQTKQSLENLKAILAVEKLSFDNVVKTTVFLKDMNDFSAMNAVYADCFTQDCPARACVQVAKLPKDALVEIELVAVY
jgi:2-iminobutanoate/2-iminopropanoate deaminase